MCLIYSFAYNKVQLSSLRYARRNTVIRRDDHYDTI